MQKQKEKQMFFEIFSFIEKELEKTKKKLSKSKPNKTEFQAQTSTML